MEDEDSDEPRKRAKGTSGEEGLVMVVGVRGAVDGSVVKAEYCTGGDTSCCGPSAYGPTANIIELLPGLGELACRRPRSTGDGDSEA
jgi:hypothetical protein